MGLELDDEVWDATVFRNNRDRLLTHEVAEMFLEQIKAQASVGGLLSKEYFSTDGTLLDAAASIKSFKRKRRKTTLRVAVRSLTSKSQPSWGVT